MSTSTFKTAAEKRIRQLEDRERERLVAREARAAEQQAGQAALRARRDQAQRDAAEQAAAEMRARLAKHFGIAGSRVNLAAEVYLFVLEHRGLAVAYTRTKGDDRRVSWQLQAGLQRALNCGVDLPVIVTGAQILDHTQGIDRLVVDPEPGELAPLKPPTEGPR
jgi:hypothetical protein